MNPLGYSSGRSRRHEQRPVVPPVNLQRRKAA